VHRAWTGGPEYLDRWLAEVNDVYPFQIGLKPRVNLLGHVVPERAGEHSLVVLELESLDDLMRRLSGLGQFRKPDSEPGRVAVAVAVCSRPSEASKSTAPLGDT
jgi:hypothetical protein